MTQFTTLCKNAESREGDGECETTIFNKEENASNLIEIYE